MSNQRPRRLFSKAEAARRAGVSRAAMTTACNGPLRPAVVAGKVDIDAPEFIEYRRRQRADATGMQHDPLYQDALVVVLTENAATIDLLKQRLHIGFERARLLLNAMQAQGVISPVRSDGKRYVLLSGNTPRGGDSQDNEWYYGEISGFLELTLRDALRQFGDTPLFKDWLEALRTIETIKLKELQVSERQAEMIPREMVENHIFALLESHEKRLLLDFPKILINAINPLVKSGCTSQQSEKLIVDLVSRQLKTIKEEMRQTLLNKKRTINRAYRQYVTI